MQTPDLNIAGRIGADTASANLMARAERLAGAKPGSRPKSEPKSESASAAEAAAAGRELEALFATLLVKEMRRALPNEGFFGEGVGADTFNGWMDEFVGAKLADAGALELAGMVKAALTQRVVAEEPPAR